MGLNKTLPLIREIAIAWRSFQDILKYISPNDLAVSLCMKPGAHFTFDFLVMGFSFCHKTLLLFLPWLRTDPAGAGQQSKCNVIHWSYVLGQFLCSHFTGMESPKYVLAWFFPFSLPLLSIRSPNCPSAVSSTLKFKAADTCKQ